MPLSPDDVIGAFKYILGRPPEDQEVINYFQKKFNDLHGLRVNLLSSHEFQALMSKWIKTHNEPISGLELSRRRLVFMHIPKTAGTTLGNILRQAFDGNEIFPRYNDVLKYPVGNLSKYRLFIGHIDLFQANHIPGPKFVFSFIREPKRRIISQYNFHRMVAQSAQLRENQPMVEKAKMPLEAYLADPYVRQHVSVSNLQARYLFCLTEAIRTRFDIRSSINKDSWFGLSRTDVVEIVKDNLEVLTLWVLLNFSKSSMRSLLNELDIAAPPEYRSFKVTSGSGSVKFDDINSSTSSLLDGLVDIDVEVYEFAKTLFETRYRITSPVEK